MLHCSAHLHLYLLVHLLAQLVLVTHHDEKTHSEQSCQSQHKKHHAYHDLVCCCTHVLNASLALLKAHLPANCRLKLPLAVHLKLNYSTKYHFPVQQNYRVRVYHRKSPLVSQQFPEQFFIFVALCFEVLDFLVDLRRINFQVYHLSLGAFFSILFCQVIIETLVGKSSDVSQVLFRVMLENEFLPQIFFN